MSKDNIIDLKELMTRKVALDQMKMVLSRLQGGFIKVVPTDKKWQDDPAIMEWCGLVEKAMIQSLQKEMLQMMDEIEELEKKRIITLEGNGHVQL